MMTTTMMVMTMAMMMLIFNALRTCVALGGAYEQLVKR